MRSVAWRKSFTLDTRLGIGLLEKVQNFLEALFVVDPHFRNSVSEHVSHGTQDWAQLAMNQTRSPSLIGRSLHPLPQEAEVVTVGLELGGALVFAGGPDDPAARRVEGLDDLLEAVRSSGSVIRRETPTWTTFGR